MSRHLQDKADYIWSRQRLQESLEARLTPTHCLEVPKSFGICAIVTGPAPRQVRNVFEMIQVQSYSRLPVQSVCLAVTAQMDLAAAAWVVNAVSGLGAAN